MRRTPSVSASGQTDHVARDCRRCGAPAPHRRSACRRRRPCRGARPTERYHSMSWSLEFDERDVGGHEIGDRSRRPSTRRRRCAPGGCGPRVLASMRRASSSSTGLARISPSRSTVVSAARTHTAPSRSSSCATRSAFAAATRSTVGPRVFAGVPRLVDLGRVGAERRHRPSVSNSWRRGDCEARTSSSARVRAVSRGLPGSPPTRARRCRACRRASHRGATPRRRPRCGSPALRRTCPDSPMPLAPSGLRGLSVWVFDVSKLHSSAADGIA